MKSCLIYRRRSLDLKRLDLAHRHSAALSVLAATLLSAGAWAQTSDGIFQGEVRDSSKARIPQAGIVIRSVDKGTEIRATSTSDGRYFTLPLVPGAYLLTATKPGFQSGIVGRGTLLVNQTVRVAFDLRPG